MQLELLCLASPWFVVGMVLLALAFAGFTLAVLTVASWGDSDSVEVDGESVTCPHKAQTHAAKEMQHE